MPYQLYQKINASGQMKEIELAATVTVEKYTQTIAETAWQGSAAPYSYTIPAATHGKGAEPVWQIRDNQFCAVDVSATGDVTIYTNVKKAIKIIIV